MKHSYFALLVMCFLSTLMQSQWSREEGKGYYKLSTWYLEANQHYTDTGEIDPNATRIQFNVNFYGEYGISNNLTAIAYVPFFSRTLQNDIFSATTQELIIPGEAVNGIGDIDLGLQYGLLQKENFVLAAVLIAGLPTGNDSGGSDGSYQTGDGEFNQYIRITAGMPFQLGSLQGYGKGFFGFNNRTQDFSDELRGGVEFGSNLFKGFWLASRLELVESLQNGSRNAQNTQGSIFANNVEFLSLGFQASYYLTNKIGLSVDFATALSGKIIYAAPSFSAGVFLDVK